MLNHVDLSYLKTGDQRIILHRYMPQNLRKQNTLLLTDQFEELRGYYRKNVDRTRKIVQQRGGKSLIFPCQKFSQIPYEAVTENVLRRSLLLQEESNKEIAVIPLFNSPSVKQFQTVEHMFNRILQPTPKLKGAIISSTFLDEDNSLTALRRSELDFLFFNAKRIDYRNLADFYERLDKLLGLEKPVFVIDAVLFTGIWLFAPRLSDTGIYGYSLQFVDYYIPSESTYYDVSNGNPKRYKSHSVMKAQYGSDDFPLSEICNCSICANNTIGSFFFGNDMKPWEKNRLHKLEFAEISSSEGTSESPEQATVP